MTTHRISSPLVVPLAKGDMMPPGEKSDLRFIFKTLARVTGVRVAVPGVAVEEMRLRGEKMLHNRATGRPGDELIITLINNASVPKVAALFLDLREPTTL